MRDVVIPLVFFACVACMPPADNGLEPAIDEVIPAIANIVGGDVITITGRNLDPEELEITIGGRALLNLTEVGVDRFTAVVPEAPPGVADVQVKNGRGQGQLPGSFEFRVWTGSQRGMDESEVSGIASHPSEPDWLYAVTRGGSIFRSDDRGDTWREVGIGITHGGQNFLATGIRDPRVLLAVCEQAYVCRSTNGGVTWRPVIAECCANAVFAVPDRGALYVAAHGYLARSDDDGATWALRRHPGRSFHRVAADPSDPRRLFALAPSGEVLVSGDDGHTFTTTGEGIPAGYTSDVLPLRTPGRVVAATFWGLFSSADSGATFTESTHPSEWYERVLADPADPQRLVAAGASVVESFDQGTTWSQAGPPLPDSSMTAHFPPSGVLHVGTSSDGVFSLEAGEWRGRNSGLAAPTAYALALGPGSSLITTTWRGRMYRSNGAQDWTLIGAFMTAVRPAALQAPAGMRVFAQAPGPLSSGWEQAPGATEWAPSTHRLVTADPTDLSKALALEDGALAATSDGGDAWTPIEVPFAGELHAIAARVTTGGTEWFVLSAGGVFVYGADSGWRSAGPALGFAPTKLVATVGGSLVAFVDGRLSSTPGAWRLPPGGAAWQDLVTVTGPAMVAGLGAAVAGPDSVVLGTYQSAFYSADGGETWTTTDLLPGAAGNDFVFEYHNDRSVHAALGGRGVLSSRTGGRP